MIFLASGPVHQSSRKKGGGGINKKTRLEPFFPRLSLPLTHILWPILKHYSSKLCIPDALYSSIRMLPLFYLLSIF